MKEQFYKLPNNSITEDSRFYCDSWEEIGKIISKKYNCDIIGYDPGVIVCPKGRYMNASVSLPMWLVNEMIK